MENLEYLQEQEMLQHAEEYNHDINIHEEKYSEIQKLITSLQMKTCELSYSWLKEFLKSPSHFLAYKLKDKTPPTESMIFGSMVDCLITEPYNFDKNFVIVEKVPSTDNQINFCNDVIKGISIEDAFNSYYKRGKAEDTYNELESYILAIKSKKTTTTQDQYDKAKEVANKLLENPNLIIFLEEAKSFQEKSIVEYEGWKIKRFTDLKTIVNSNHITADLKLMSQLNPDSIQREILKMDYDLQGAVYTLDNVDRYFNICYDKNANLIISEYDQSIMQYGKEKLDYILNGIDKCCENPHLFSENYNFHDLIDEDLGLKTKRIYKPGYVKSYR